MSLNTPGAEDGKFSISYKIIDSVSGCRNVDDKGPTTVTCSVVGSCRFALLIVISSIFIFAFIAEKQSIRSSIRFLNSNRLPSCIIFKISSNVSSIVSCPQFLTIVSSGSRCGAGLHISYRSGSIDSALCGLLFYCFVLLSASEGISGEKILSVLITLV